MLESQEFRKSLIYGAGMCGISYRWARAGGRAVDLGGPSVYHVGPKFEIKHKSRCIQKSKLVNWGGQACRLGGQDPPGPPWLRPCGVPYK